MNPRAIIFLFLICFQVVLSVDRSKFRTCSQASFCSRNRAKDTLPRVSPYQLQAGSIQLDHNTLTAHLQNINFPLQPPLVLTVDLLQNNVVRTRVSEKDPLFKRFEVPDVLQEAGLKKLANNHIRQGFQLQNTSEKHQITAVFGEKSEHQLIISVAPLPFHMEVVTNGETAISSNSLGLMNFEHHRQRHPAPPPPAEGEAPHPPPQDFPYDIDGMWEESFGGHSDSKPRGPSAVSLDFTFHGSEHVYGIPEHASSLSLKSTIGERASYNEPYRLYNLDVFEYELDVPMALYGAVPLLLSHDTTKTTGVFWLNAAETFIDISDGKNKLGNPKKDAHFISESGIIDAFFLLGPSPRHVMHQYATLTGFPALPQLFAIAYHQCRWNYKDEADVAAVDAGFDQHDIPYDVLWLDIEHTDGKKYFTWDKSLFPNPIQMQQNLAARGRKMVTIIDPHIKRDSGYRLHNDASSRGYYVKNKAGGEYDGWCWPGSVSYLDFTSPDVRHFWASQFTLDSYEGSSSTLYTWNDMNEPSVFNGPETTMPKEMMHANNVEHRDVHNMYGFYQHMATADGLVLRSSRSDRPFVLSRSFFAGSQRFGAVWTGDNRASWDHLRASMPMLLSLNVAGIPFSGADVGGFFGDPDPELLVRWYQAGAYQPFFRGHAHIDTKRREPWLFGEQNTALIRNAIRSRYMILPYIYTCFYLAASSGMPVMRPLWLEYPRDEQTFGMEDQFLLGSDLLVKPVTQASQHETHVYLPSPEPWYDVDTSAAYAGGQTINMPTPIYKIPVFQRGGSILPRKERVRRSSSLMEKDPFTLVVALNSKNEAEGLLYLDDGKSFAYQQGAYLLRHFHYAQGKLTASKSSLAAPPTSRIESTTIERIVFLGVTSAPRSVELDLHGSRIQLEFTHDNGAHRLIIRKPNVVVADDFVITIS